MRIKSYFAPSVQSAIALARKEFGEGVTLVTSHVASPENRSLGEYEVVFAIEEQPQPAAPADNGFSVVLQQVISTPSSLQLNAPEKLDQLRSLLVELGLDPAMVLALLTMVERCAGVPASALITTQEAAALVIAQMPAPAIIREEPVPTETATPEPAGNSKYSAAELAFLDSVSDANRITPASLPTWTLGSQQ